MTRALMLAWVALAAGGAAATPAVASAPARFVGIQAWDEPPAEEFGRLSRAKVNTWRANLVWRNIEEARGKYTWGRYDTLFANAAANNVRIMPVLIGSPKWANATVHYPPKNATTTQAFYKFAEAATRRYGQNGTFWRGKGRPTSVRPLYWQI